MGEKIRYHFLDEVRGLAICCMLVFHSLFTVSLFTASNIPVNLINFFMPAQPFFSWLFVFISGISCNLSHSNLVRGLKLAPVAVALTAVTVVLNHYNIISVIDFGILHLLSVGMILWGLAEKLQKKIIPAIGLAIMFALFLITYSVPYGKLAFFIKLPEVLYKNSLLSFVGFPHSTYASDDYFPLIPWLFAFFSGGFLGRIFVTAKFPEFFKKSYVKPFGFLGRHGLIIYIVHQPVIYGLCFIISKLAGQ